LAPELLFFFLAQLHYRRSFSPFLLVLIAALLVKNPVNDEERWSVENIGAMVVMLHKIHPIVGCFDNRNSSFYLF
jgi:hypothetical protein